MAKVAKYIKKQDSEDKHLTRLREKEEERLLSKKINKTTNRQLLDIIIKDANIRSKVSSTMYNSNPSKSFWNRFTSLFNGKQEEIKSKFINLISILLDVSDNIIAFDGVFSILSTVLEYHSEYLRPVETWVPKSRNAEQQFYSLIRHLFTKYPTPVFLEKSFLTNHFEGVFMYLHLGSGKSLKNYAGYPNGMIVHNKAAHHLYTTPEDLEFFQAIRRAQILYLGGDEYIFNALMRSNHMREREANILHHDEFWQTVMKFFIDNTMIEPTKIAEIIDYIHHVKFEPRQTRVDGITVNHPPEHPNFSMKARNPQTLIDQSDEWHYYKQRIAQANRRLAVGNNNYNRGSYVVTNYSWKGYLINNKTYTKGKAPDGTPIQYKIIQLLSSHDLRDEGNYMHHCVGSYASICSAGKCAIFSVRYYEHNKEKDTTATVEVRDERIVQVRGKYNRRPDEKTLLAIRNWANDEYLTIGTSAL